jgi:hypothetical protein
MKYLLIPFLALYLGGCVATEVKAPCNYQGDFCGHKTRINQS